MLEGATWLSWGHRRWVVVAYLATSVLFGGCAFRWRTDPLNVLTFLVAIEHIYLLFRHFFTIEMYFDLHLSPKSTYHAYNTQT